VGILKNLAEVGKVVTRDMARVGVGILAGCDAMIPGFCVHDELAAMVAGGTTPLAALQTATVNPARYLGRESSGFACDNTRSARRPAATVPSVGGTITRIDD